MFLRELHVENCRAVESASLVLDVSTTLIGENDCGKGSLFRALELVLGTAEQRASLASRDLRLEPGQSRPSQPLRVRLQFEERAPGDWDAPCHEPLRGLLRSRRAGRRALVLEAVSGDGAGELAVRIADERDGTAQRAAIEHVRAMTPLIRVAGGMLSGHSAGDAQRAKARIAGSRGSNESAALVATVVRCADEVLSGVAAQPERAIERGAQAARELMARSPQHYDPIGSGLSDSVAEILGWQPAARLGGTARSTSMAERLGTLLLVAALLRNLPHGLAPGIDPLWIVEDPEAHLHPMTLAATQRTLERIRWQRIVSTQSGELLAAVPLAQIRRLLRHEGHVRTAGIRPRSLSAEDLRRVGYHVRMHRGVAMFARVWLLVEGESEFWVLPQVASVLGYDLALEGVCCVGFAQCGVRPLVRTARELGIEWHLLADGDDAGQRYVEAARAFLRRGEERERLTLLRERDIEHCFWHHGHADTVLDVAAITPEPGRRLSPTRAIAKAIERRSKPFLALSLVESVARRGPRGVPAPLAQLIETCVALARRAPARVVSTRRRHEGP